VASASRPIESPSSPSTVASCAACSTIRARERSPGARRRRAEVGPGIANPGQLLCVALATCQDGLIRMMAGALGIELEQLEVEVSGLVDVRGTMNLASEVPVGFQSLSMAVRLRAAPGTPPRLLERLRHGAERLCVNLETLRGGVPVETRYELEAVGGS
jgi:uncharacterized OsmC-like protein